MCSACFSKYQRELWFPISLSGTHYRNKVKQQFSVAITRHNRIFIFGRLSLIKQTFREIGHYLSFSYFITCNMTLLISQLFFCKQLF